MKRSLKTRNQLLYTVASLTLISVLIAGICFVLFQRDHEIYRMSTAIHKIYEHFNNAATCEENFFYKEAGSPGYLGSEDSYSTRKFEMHVKAMNLQLEELSKRKALTSFGLEQDVEKLRSELSKYETLFTFAMNKADKSGMDNFGSSLNLQRQEWQLESKSDELGLSNVLALEKMEKDYLLKNDASYIAALEAKIEDINSDISKNSAFDFQEKVALVELLQDFKHSFLDMVKSQENVGLQDEEQLSDQLFSSKGNIHKQFIALEKKLSLKEQVLTSNIENVLLLFIINIVTLTIFIIFLFTRRTPRQQMEDEYHEEQNVVSMHNPAIAS